ncbi:MAG: polyketide synthase, partial [Elusimicrobia bacterium]|nr:polyketide synthase [Elusimicrobiota bacterium]
MSIQDKDSSLIPHPSSLAEPIAIVGLGAVLPQAPNVPAFWKNILEGKNCIIEVPQDRWDWNLYYDPDPQALDKTYSKIGGFVKDFKFDPLKFRIPPPVAQQMDSVQQMAVAATQEALQDAGLDDQAGAPAKRDGAEIVEGRQTRNHKRSFNSEKTAVILGNSMGGTKKESTDQRVYCAYTQDILRRIPSFTHLEDSVKKQLLEELEKETKTRAGVITEDTMPGELSNVIAGRVANAFNFNGPNFTVDAACASSLAALDMAVHGLRFREYDMAVCGGVDQMMAPTAFVKFCKIGALSPDGSRPFDARANGFVMGEGVGIFILKRLSDALKDGDKIYALVRAIGTSSDGRGKGITAPNPKGQKFAVERTFKQLDYTPDKVGLVEAHGTSTRVGDVTEVGVLSEIFGPYVGQKQSLGLGSVKSQIGHLKAAAGAAGIIKAALAIHHKVKPPSINFQIPNPEIKFPQTPFRVVTKAEAWDKKEAASFDKRRANVSSFGFGGTNFHVALEENDGSYAPRIPDFKLMEQRPQFALAAPGSSGQAIRNPQSVKNVNPSLMGEMFTLSGDSLEEITVTLNSLPQDRPEPYPLILDAQPTNHQPGKKYQAFVAVEAPSKIKEKYEI